MSIPFHYNCLLCITLNIESNKHMKIVDKSSKLQKIDITFFHIVRHQLVQVPYVEEK
jgi:hypothetical protein